ncbi:MAG: universal stress protein [Acidimicrobiia bacterium]
MSGSIVIVATDLSESSEPVIREAADLASRLNAELLGVHVLTATRMAEIVESSPPDSAYVDVIEDRYATNIERQLAAVPDGVPVRTKVLVGEEAAQVHRLAREEAAEFIVIGIQNRSRVGKLIMGSTAQEILLGSPCPVVGVPIP